MILPGKIRRSTYLHHAPAIRLYGPAPARGRTPIGRKPTTGFRAASRSSRTNPYGSKRNKTGSTAIRRWAVCRVIPPPIPRIASQVSTVEEARARLRAVIRPVVHRWSAVVINKARDPRQPLRVRRIMEYVGQLPTGWSAARSRTGLSNSAPAPKQTMPRPTVCRPGRAGRDRGRGRRGRERQPSRSVSWVSLQRC